METKIFGIVETLIYERKDVIQQGNFPRAREIQRNLHKINIEIEDARHGTKWAIN
ncbi:MAG: hypothetical protein MUO85_06080 [candidate division Zixibacteria bacterium]|nr:hypothetical protein [candidate division Zixibacteria bacterium]